MLFALCLAVSLAMPVADSSQSDWYTSRFQQTIVYQAHPSFSAPYSGKNSLSTESESAISLTATLFLTIKLWKGGEFTFTPEIAGGEGLSGAVGVAGFPNGETFRVGQAKPVVYPARAYVKQVFNLSDETRTATAQTLAGATATPSELFRRSGTQNISQLTLIAGKFGVADFFDANSYSHDPRTQFMNWSLMSTGAWDYPADTRGYTWGIAMEYMYNAWALRALAVLVPKTANGLEMDTRISEARGEAVELEYNYALGEKNRLRKGIVRALAFRNLANAGTFRTAIRQGTVMNSEPDITAARSYGTVKYGFGASIEQELTDNIGAFARGSWNDGATETWAFTQIDHSVSAGVQFGGKLWNRSDDVLGTAFVVNGISQDHRDYLAAGGYGFIIGDGMLNYAPETIVEAYYRFQWNAWLTVSGDYQFIANPAYNHDRGPVHVFSVRTHIEL